MQQEPRDSHYMELALQQAAQAPRIGEVPIGAVLVRNHEVIAAGHNYREISQDPTAHAEMIVIRKAAERLRTWRLSDTILYVTLEPCAMCAGAIVQSRIARLVFGAWDPKAGACGSIFDIPTERRLNHRVHVRGGLLEQESCVLLQEFFRARRDTLSERNSPQKRTS
ncbi:tRNA adenosine(34) deaminase TadA [Candidatus Nitrospira nitrificans]|nr:tRNA adenosine(34) deaminase TadA [Candidatus Nitrospira nitrificans]